MSYSIYRRYLGTSVLFLFLLSLLATGCQSEKTNNSGTGDVSSKPAVKLVSGTIVGGIGVKELKLGVSGAEAEQILGTPSERDSNEFREGQTFLLFHDKGIELTLQDDKVEVITLHTSTDKWNAYRGATAEGIGVTSSARDVEIAFGTAEEEASRSLRYRSKGLWFRFDKNREGHESQAKVESLSVLATEKKS